MERYSDNRMFSVTRACTFLKSNSQILMKQVILDPHMVRKMVAKNW